MQRRSPLVGYSSLALLIAIAAIALLGQPNGGGEKPAPSAGIVTTR
jgi:hypothetical protein